MNSKSSPDFMMAWVSLIHSSSYLLMSLSRYLEETAGLTLSEQDLMARLQGRGGRARMSDLAGLLFVTKAGMTKMVDRLERRGWVKRTRCPEDGRVKLVEIQPKGLEVLKTSWGLMRPWIKENFADHFSSQELDQLGRSLKEFMERSGHYETMAKRLNLKK